MKWTLPVVGIVLGFAIGVVGFALAAVGLMAMGTDLVVFFGGVFLLAAAVGVITTSALVLWRARPTTRA